MEADHNSRGRRQADEPVVGQTGARFGGAVGRRSRAMVEPPEEDDAVAAQHHGGDQAGVRFPPVLSRWRRRLAVQDPKQQPEQQEAEPTGTSAPAGPQPAGRPGAPQPELMPPASEPDRVSEPDPVEAADWGRSKESYDLVRPYSWTGGRTAPRVGLAVETLVSATGRPPDPSVRPEHRTILQLCAIPHSVAELAAMLSIPLGVAQVLLGDLAAAGSVTVHRTVGAADAAPDVVLLQRVLNGLRRL